MRVIDRVERVRLALLKLWGCECDVRIRTCGGIHGVEPASAGCYEPNSRLRLAVEDAHLTRLPHARPCPPPLTLHPIKPCRTQHVSCYRRLREQWWGCRCPKHLESQPSEEHLERLGIR